jgi:predicted DNA-binding transcriptional regulator AlpA
MSNANRINANRLESKMFEGSKVGLDVYMRQRQLLRDHIVPFSAPTLWRRVKDGSFPQPVKLSPGVTAWRLRDIQEWQRAQGGTQS